MCHYEAAMHKIDEDNHGWYPWEFTHIVNHRGHYRKLCWVRPGVRMNNFSLVYLVNNMDSQFNSNIDRDLWPTFEKMKLNVFILAFLCNMWPPPPPPPPPEEEGGGPSLKGTLAKPGEVGGGVLLVFQINQYVFDIVCQCTGTIAKVPDIRPTWASCLILYKFDFCSKGQVTR